MVSVVTLVAAVVVEAYMVIDVVGPAMTGSKSVTVMVVVPM